MEEIKEVEQTTEKPVKKETKKEAKKVKKEVGANGIIKRNSASHISRNWR